MKFRVLIIAIAIYQLVCAAISFYLLYTIFDLHSIDMLVILAIVLVLSSGFLISGIGLVQGHRWGYHLAAWMFIAQTPMLMSSWASYFFKSILAVYLKITASNGFLIGFDFKLRSSIDFFIGYNNINGFVFGINIFALAAALLLFSMLRVERRIEPDSSGA